MENLTSDNEKRVTRTKEQMTRDYCEEELKWVTQHKQDLENYIKVLQQQLQELNTKAETNNTNPPIQQTPIT